MARSQKQTRSYRAGTEKSQKQFIVQRPWTYATSKNYGLDKKFQTYKGRVVQRGDIVKDDSGSCAVFTEQGSSASHRTAAKVLCEISRLPRTRTTSKCCSVGLHSIEIGRRSKVIGITRIRVPAIWIRPPRSRRPKYGTIFKTQWYHLKDTPIGQDCCVSNNSKRS